jgi:hypothetical protein
MKNKQPTLARAMHRREVRLDEGYANQFLGTLPRDGATVATAEMGACTAVYTWRADAADADAAARRAPRVAILPSGAGTESFAARQLLAHRDDHVLLTAREQRHAGVVAEWDCEREVVARDYALRMTSALPLAAAHLALAAPADGATTALVGVGRATLFRATLDARAPRVALAFTSGRDDANTWRHVKHKSGAEHTCVATCADGRFVTGDSSGALRLFRDATRATLVFDIAASPVRALDVSPDGTWIVATYDTYVLVVGPFDAAWQHTTHAEVASARLVLSAKERAFYSIGAATHYAAAHIVGYDGAAKETAASVVVALGALLLTFPLRRRAKRHTAAAARAPARAPPPCIHTLLKRLARARATAPVGASDAAEGTTAPAPSCVFERCTVFEAPARIVDHVARENTVAHEMIALETRLIDLAL